MRLTFLGGVQTVTGSCYLMDTAGGRVLVDCGMFQGHMEERNWRTLSFDPSGIDAVLLTHSHIDHSGFLPRLVKLGFSGRVIGTAPALELCQIMLLDSAHLQEMEAEHISKKNLRKGRSPVEPLYTVADAAKAFPLFHPVRYRQEVEVVPGVKASFHDAGHILGSAIVKVRVEEDKDVVQLVFSGDLGRYGGLILKDPTPIEHADVVLVESTYGNRLHKNESESEDELIEIINRAHREKGKVLIPSFAVGRTQELLYLLNNAHNKGRIPYLPVFLDSPLAIAATEIFERHPECFDEETLEVMRRDYDPFSFPGLKMVRSSDESRVLNNVDQCVIIAGSGMCNGGRIKHHLKHGLWRHNTHVIFVGFQAQGTLGRRLVDGARKVKIYGEEIEVNAKIHTLGGFSAHADQSELLRWLGGFESSPAITFVVHGEESSSQAFAAKVEESLGWRTHLPAMRESVDLAPHAIGPFHAPEMEPAVPPEVQERFVEVEGVLYRLHEELEHLHRHPYGRETKERIDRLAKLLKRVERELREVR